MQKKEAKDETALDECTTRTISTRVVTDLRRVDLKQQTQQGINNVCSWRGSPAAVI